MIDRARVLKFYRGKARNHAEAALAVLEIALEAGCWPKGASRGVKAALRKTGARETALAESTAQAARYRHADWVAIRHGTFERATAEAYDEVGGHRPIITGTDVVLEWIEAFRPVADAVAALDAARPKPVYVFAAISPTVHANVAGAMGLEFASVEQPPIEWHQVDQLVDKRTVKAWVPEIKWPEGTVHNASRFARGSAAGNDQCQACGHAIKNQGNWVPLVLRGLDDGTNPPGVYALWVGKDCAKNMFGCKVDGELWAASAAKRKP